MQEEMTRFNKQAWETGAYEAWVRHYGEPERLAEELKRTHRHMLRYWLKYIGDPAGLRVLNLLGSNGRKAIALAMMGADVTVVDLSEDNRLYATRTADAAGVLLRYVCADVLHIPDEASLGPYDVVLMEFGILHYFADLAPLLAVVRRRLGNGSRLVLTDFHPFARAVRDGAYFDDGVREGEVAFAKLLPEERRDGLRPVRVRGWTVGDIVAAVAEAGLSVRAFEELPGSEGAAMPAYFTLVADRIERPMPPLYR